MTHSFPKIIWQTHNHKQSWMPEHLKAISSYWINLNPGWEYRYVNQVEREETVKKYPHIYEMYKYQLPVYQSDIWRFITLYENGGCYADMDSIPAMPLDYMIKKIGGDPEIITVPTHNGMGNNHNFLAKKNSTILKSVVDSMNEWSEISLDQMHPWSSFVTKVYSAENSENVSQLFEAVHSLDFKKRFITSKQSIDNYGKIMKYEDFVKENNLELIYRFEDK